MRKVFCFRKSKVFCLCKVCFTVSAAACLVLGLTSAVQAVGYLTIHPSNPHYFQEVTTGKAVLIATHTAIVPSDTSYDYVAGIAEMHSRRIAYARVWHFLPWAGEYAVWPWARSDVGGAPMGGNKIDMNTWNSTYWNRMTDSLSKANTGGTYAEIHLFDRCGMSPASPTRWQGNPWAYENNINNLETPTAYADGTPDFYYYSTKPNLRNQQERYIEKMIDETIGYPNVIYEIENEHWEHNDPDWVSHYSDFVKDYISTNYPSSPRLVSYNSLESDLEDCYTISTVDIVNPHFGNQAEDDPSIMNDYIESRWYHNKPINVDEFANGVTSADLLIEMCWTIVASGGHFHIEDAAPSSNPFDICENIRSFIALSGWDFISSAPDSSLITSGGGYCMADEGVEYVCYFPSGGSKRINLAAGSYREEWWNPHSGGFYNVANFSHGGGNTWFTAPDGGDWVLHIDTAPAPTTVLESKAAGTITIDGNTGDWNLGQFTSKICGGNTGTGDTGLVGYDTNGVCYAGGHATGLQFAPENAADHAVKIYSRNNASYLYLLLRLDDQDIQTPNGVSSNWGNDCVEFYIDPGHDGGSTGISNSTSDIQLVIDAANQANVYMTTSGYKTQVLAGVTSAVSTDSTGWYLEVRISKSALDPDIPATGTIGIDFAFRDNDQNSNTYTTIYSWREPEVSSGFPTKIPDRWGDLELQGDGDTTPPGPVTNFTATAGEEQVSLSWTNPTDSDFTGTMIRYKTTGYPTSVTDGTLVVDKSASPGSNDSYDHTGLTGGVTYYYSAFAHDGVPNYSTKADASATPTSPDTTPPGPVTSFVATAGAGMVSLSWTNPTDSDFTGTMIRYKTTGYPTSVTDGTLVVDKSASPGSNDSYDHTGLTGGVTYYYSAFAHDGVPNYSSAANASATPTVGVDCPTLVAKEAGTITIDGSTGDWNLSAFTTNARGGQDEQGDIALIGYDGGTCYYGGYNTSLVLPTNAADHTAKVYSRHSAAYQYFLVRCDDDQINYANGVDTNWANDCVEFYIDPSHNGGSSPMSNSTSDVQLVVDADNRVNVYMTTSGYKTQVLGGVTSAVTRDGTGWWAEVRITKSALDPDIPEDGTFGVDFCFRDNDNPDSTYWYGHPSYSTMYSWSDNPSGTSFPTKVPDTWGDIVLPELTPDTTPPGPVTNFTATAGVEQVALSWTNPTDSDFTATMIRYRTDTYPTSVTNGTLVVDKSGSPGANDNYTHTGLTGGVTYYYAAWAHDAVPNYSTSSATDSATPTESTVDCPTLNAKEAGTITIDGSTSDWNLSEFTTKARGGEAEEGDYAIVGYDGGTLYYGGYWTGGTLPTSAADHTAKVYSRHNATYQYFLVRCDDSDMNYANGVDTNWANDCVEFYIDPSHNGGSSPMSDSTSDIQLVVDADNRVNVYMTTSGYKTQVLAGVTSAVARDGTGWWAEVRIQKSALDPDIPADGTFGVDFCFRDNDNPDETYYAGNPAYSTMYSWSDDASGAAFPTKIPDHWGDIVLPEVPGPTVISNSQFTSGADGWSTATWRSGTWGYGTMEWQSSGGNSGGCMLSTGNGESDDDGRCLREGGEISKTISTAGHSGIKVYYDLKVNTLSGDYTGVGTGECDVDHNLVDEQLTVFYSTNGGTNWTEAEWTKRATLLASYQSYGSRTVDLTGVSACNDNANFALRFRWQFNHTSDSGWLDNIRVEANN